MGCYTVFLSVVKWDMFSERGRKGFADICRGHTLFLGFFACISILSLPQANLQCSTDSVFSIKYLGLTSPRPSLDCPSAVSLCLPPNSSHSPSLLLIFFFLLCVSGSWWWWWIFSQCFVVSHLPSTYVLSAVFCPLPRPVLVIPSSELFCLGLLIWLNFFLIHYHIFFLLSS